MRALITRKICYLLIAFLWTPQAIADSEEVAEEVYLLAREKEILAFSATGDQWVSLDLRSREQVLASKYGGHVAVVFTNNRVLGFSTLTNNWSEEKLKVDEVMVSIEADGNVGTVITNLRAFGFSAKTGRWVVRRLGLE
jgi:hypothetical protein